MDDFKYRGIKNQGAISNSARLPATFLWFANSLYGTSPMRIASDVGEGNFMKD